MNKKFEVYIAVPARIAVVSESDTIPPAAEQAATSEGKLNLR